MGKQNKKKRTSNYKKQLGQIPGALVYTGSKLKEELFIETFDYQKLQCTETQCNNVSDVFGFKTTETVSWINVNGLNHTKQIEKLGNHYNLHPLVLEDIVHTSQRPKIDEYEDYLFLVIKMMYYNADEVIVSEQISFVLGDYFVLSFQEAEGDIFDTLRDRIRHGNGRIRSCGADYLLYALMDAIVDHYYAIIETMGHKIEDLEDQLLEDSSRNEITNKIQTLKREVLKIRKSILPIREIIHRIDKSESSLINEKTHRYFNDIHDHLVQISETIDVYREMVWSLMDMYMSTISNRMNEIMKVLTILSAIFIPLTFIAGIYGMNFETMPELKLTYGYFYILGLMLVIFLLMIFYFKRKKWL